MENNSLVIDGGVLIDGNGDVSSDNIVVIEDSVIKLIGKKGEVDIPDGAEVINAAGKTVMPGMIDAHVHLASVVGVSTDAEYAVVKTPKPLLLLHAVYHAREMLEAGYTAIRDCVGMKQRYENVSLRSAVDMGLIPGPRIVACVWIENTGGAGDWTVNWIDAWPEREDSPCADGPWEIRKRVREAARAGVDQIKTASSGHYKGFGPLGRSGGLKRSQTREEFAALVDEAHANGMKVMCHSHGSAETMKHAIEAGVDTIEHAIPLTDEIIQMLSKSNIIIVPTLSIMMRDKERGSQLSPEEADKRKLERLARIKKAHHAGVRIAMGTDTYRLIRDYWGKNAYELQCFVEAGMSEMEAIISTTKTAAEALGLEDHIGTIEPGKFADIIIVDGNPLEDIEILQDNEKILYVIKNGEIEIDRTT